MSAEVYEFVQHGHRIDENELVVEFSFTAETTKEQAIDIVDKIVMLANNHEQFEQLTGHKPKMYALSPFREEITDV
tara:strand:- start:1639 stop:1866 length:228 start_codon:yes stop_codon:yes gene_type:complete